MALLKQAVPLLLLLFACEPFESPELPLCVNDRECRSGRCDLEAGTCLPPEPLPDTGYPDLGSDTGPGRPDRGAQPDAAPDQALDQGADQQVDAAICTPDRAERCNAFDDDCDGRIDEDGACAIEDVAIGEAHACAALRSGEVKCWGADALARLGTPSPQTPVWRGDAPEETGYAVPPVDFGADARAVEIAGQRHETCARFDDGQVACWGLERTARFIADLPAAESIAVGTGFACALTAGGAIYCWGQGQFGQLGQGNIEDSERPVRIDLAGDAFAISAGDHHACALMTATGLPKCWGANRFGELGLGDVEDRGDEPDEMGENLPTVDLGTSRFALDMVSGASRNCAFLNDMSIKCWGAGAFGSRLGGATPDSMGDALPALILGDAPVTGVSVSQTHNCIVQAGLVRCWGRNEGALGTENRFSSNVVAGDFGGALRIAALGEGEEAVRIFTGLHMTCAGLSTGRVKCWGRNYDARLLRGDGLRQVSTQIDALGEGAPVVDLAGASVWRMAAGPERHCGLVGSDAFVCWGRNDGALGVGDQRHRGDDPMEMGEALAQPMVTLQPGETLTDIVCTTRATCVLTSTGQVRCWGSNIFGETGSGILEISAVPPDEPVALDGVARAIRAGEFHVCALLEGGGVKCWGDNSYGQLGLGDQVDRGKTPDQMGAALPTVELGAPALEIALGNRHSCALLEGGAVKCWGRNQDGQLGLGNDQPRGDRPEHVGRFAPADLPSPTVQIAAAGDQTCAIGVDGQLRCWGDLGGGQATDVGDEPDEMGSALRPFILGPGRRAERVFMGQTMRAVRLDDGSLRYWGTLVKTRQPGGREVRSTFTQFEDPLPVIQMAEGLTAVSFASGRDHACVLLDDGAVRCWGINFYGQLGAGGHSAVGDDPGEMGEGLPYLDLGWPSE